jgi:ParB family transcriptional regulator, chromosome partitioning protein
MRVINIPISEIKPYKNNPRKNDEAALAVADSIKEYGFRVPLLIDKNNVVIAGHTRLKAALKLGMTELPCIIADDLTPAQVRAYRLMDNKAQEKSRWDEALLQQEFQELMGMGFDLTKTGFSNLEIPEFDIEDELDRDSTDTYTAYDEDGYEDGYEAEDSSNEYEQEHGYDEYGEEPEYSREPSAGSEQYQPTVLEYVCIVCCDGEEEKQAIAEVIGERGELKRRYTVSEIVEMLEKTHEVD